MKVSQYTIMGLMNANQMSQNMKLLNKANERLATGKEINSAADNPSMMIRMSRMEAKMREERVVQNNIQDGVSLIQTADKHLESLQDSSQKLRELSVSYQNDTLSKEDRELLEEEATALLQHMKQTTENASYNSIKLFSNEKNPISIYIGDKKNSDIDLPNALNLFSNETVSNQNHSVNDSEKNTNHNILDNSENEGVISEINNNYNIEINNTTDLDEKGNKSILESLLKFGLNDLLNTISSGHFGRKKQKVEKNPTIIIVDNRQTTVNNENNISNETNIVNNHIQNGESTNDGTINNNDGGSNNTEQPNFNLEDLLNPEVIDQLFLDPIAKSRGSLGIKQNVLERQLNFSQKKEEQYTKDYSRIVDADMAKEKMNQLKHQLLLEQNLNLFDFNSQNHRGYILKLLGS